MHQTLRIEVVPEKGHLGSGFYHSLVRMFVRVMIRRRVMIFYTRTWPCPIGIGIRVNIGGAIGPGAAPGNSADDNGVRTPSKARPRPAKGHERGHRLDSGGQKRDIHPYGRNLGFRQ